MHAPTHLLGPPTSLPLRQVDAILSRRVADVRLFYVLSIAFLLLSSLLMVRTTYHNMAKT